MRKTYKYRLLGNKMTFGRASIIVEIFDKQVTTLVHSLDFKPNWKQQMAQVAAANYDGPSIESLQDKRRRTARAYGDGAYSKQEYERRLAEIDQQIEQTEVVPKNWTGC
jgi:hypothetical protein